ncbi:hypothetical protein AB8J26_001547 [Clostridium perfringens]|nr:hypothetical protein [Clostridium perfringens]
MSGLWGDLELKEITLPNSILIEAAKELANKTNDAVYAECLQIEVKRFDDWGLPVEIDPFNFGFFIKSKYMPDYSFRVFTIHYGITPYPVIVRLDSDIEDETYSKLDRFYQCGKDFVSKNLTIDSEGDFYKILPIILSSPKVKELINSLYSYSQQFVRGEA